LSRIEKLRDYPCAVFDQGWVAHEPDLLCSPELDIHHHTSHRGMSMKASDERTFPLCHRHHMDFHAARGLFRDWDKQRRREWQDEMVERYNRILCDPEAF
jgi:hypothetical protein